LMTKGDSFENSSDGMAFNRDGWAIGITPYGARVPALP
jgi:hypothetical protein